MIYITGDTHGDPARFSDARLCSGGLPGTGDYLIICGDFGYIFFDDATEHRLLDRLAQLPYTILFVDGNHENFTALYAYPEMPWHGGRVHRIRPNILHLMRGEIFEIEGKTFFAMGGAYSIDKYMRAEGVSWWPEELPDRREYDYAAANLGRHGFRVDYILTHTMPRELIRRMGKYPDGHDLELTGFLEWVMYETQFRHWYCGHWHEDRDLLPNFTVLWYDIRTVE